MNFHNLSTLGENSSFAADVSVSAAHGNITSATFTPAGKNRGAYSFKGNDYIQTNKALMNNLTQFSTAGWVYANATGTRIAFFGQNSVFEFGFIDSNTIMVWTP